MRLFKYIESGNRFIVGVVDKEYVDSFQIIYPVEFFKHVDSRLSFYKILPCNLTPANKKIEQYSINIKKFMILYDIGEDYIDQEAKRMYNEYLKLQGFHQNVIENFNML